MTWRLVGIVAALMELPSTVPGAFFSSCSRSTPIYMKRSAEVCSDEPVGIVISRGAEPETIPHFSAYEWAPSPEDETDEELQTA